MDLEGREEEEEEEGGGWDNYMDVCGGLVFTITLRLLCFYQKETFL